MDKYDLNLIVASNKEGIIGTDNNSIPWYIPEDLKYFREKTLNSIVIMGRKTFDSLPNGRPLNNRINIVITKQLSQFQSQIYPNVFYTDFTNIDDFMLFLETIIEKTNQNQNPKIFVIGGSEIYNLFFKYCKTIYVTLVSIKLEETETNTTKTQIMIKFPYDISFFFDKSRWNIIDKSELFYSKNNNIPYQHFMLYVL